MGLALVPAFATLYPRLTMPEGRKYLESQELNTPSTGTSLKNGRAATPTVSTDPPTPPEGVQGPLETPTKPVVPLTPDELEALSPTHDKKSAIQHLLHLFQRMATSKNASRHRFLLVPTRYRILRNESQPIRVIN